MIGSDPDYFKFLPLHYNSKNVKFCVHSVRVVFLFLKDLQLFHTQTSQTSNFNILQALLSCVGLSGWWAWYGAWTLCSLGRASVMWLNVIIFLFMSHLPWDIRLDYSASIPFYPLNEVLYIFILENIFSSLQIVLIDNFSVNSCNFDVPMELSLKWMCVWMTAWTNEWKVYYLCVCCYWITQLSPTLCKSLICSMRDFPVLHPLPEFA